jgi:hypothetical protein
VAGTPAHLLDVLIQTRQGIIDWHSRTELKTVTSPVRLSRDINNAKAPGCFVITPSEFSQRVQQVLIFCANELDLTFSQRDTEEFKNVYEHSSVDTIDVRCRMSSQQMTSQTHVRHRVMYQPRATAASLWRNGSRGRSSTATAPFNRRRSNNSKVSRLL